MLGEGMDLGGSDRGMAAAGVVVQQQQRSHVMVVIGPDLYELEGEEEDVELLLDLVVEGRDHDRSLTRAHTHMTTPSSAAGQGGESPVFAELWQLGIDMGPFATSMMTNTPTRFRAPPTHFRVPPISEMLAWTGIAPHRPACTLTLHTLHGLPSGIVKIKKRHGIHDGRLTLIGISGWSGDSASAAVYHSGTFCLMARSHSWNHTR